MIKEITSANNPYIKDLYKLKEKKYRNLNKRFIIEGFHLVKEAYLKGVLKEVLFVYENDIKDITGGAPASYATNANAFSFPLTVTATADTEDDTSAATADPSIEFANNKIQHELENGIYHFLYTVGTTSENNTFSTHDTNGVYQATITLTDASS